MAGELVARVVELLVREVQQSTTGRLPSARSLASRFGVSHPIVAQAARELRERGVLEFSKGQPMRVRGRAHEAAPARMSAGQTVCEALRERIARGDLRAGNQVPKLAALTAEFRSSNTTVLDALRTLASESIVHKSGRLWIVGPEPDRGRRPVTGSLESPVSLVVQNDLNALRNLARSERTSPLYRAYEAETVRFGVNTVSVYTSWAGAPPGSPVVGLDQIRDYIRSLGPRYIGALLVPHQDRFIDFEEWAAMLLDTGRPVVWFDIHDQNTTIRHSLFTRCHFSERNAVAAAVSALAALGHRSVVYLSGGTDPDGWRKRRMEMVKAEGERIGLCVRTAPGLRESLDTPRARRIVELYQRGPSSDSRWGASHDFLAAVVEALEYRDATAWIAMRDHAAQQEIWWLRMAGVRVPEDLSVISFDNRLASEITSVDFGFDYLGYAAFHLQFGLLPVPRIEGSVCSKPFVVDRGTLAPPRKGLLKAV